MAANRPSGLTLYHSATSVCSAKVRLVLAELKLEWESRMLDLAAGDQFTQEYLALNPQGVVPTLVHSGHAVTESNDIMRYLCGKFGADLSGFATAESSEWLDLSVEFHAAVNTFTQLIVNRDRLLTLPPEELAARLSNIPDLARATKLQRIVEKGFQAEQVADATISVRRILQQVDNAAGRSRWLAGNAYSLADAAILPFVTRLELLGMAEFWRERPHAASWLADARQRTTYDTAIAAYMSDQACNKFAAAAGKAQTKVKLLLNTR